MPTRLIAVVLSLCPIALVVAADPGLRTVQLDGARVRLDSPIQVAQSKGYLWYPVVHQLSDGSLLAVLCDYPDLTNSRPTGQLCWSRDQGQTWTAMRPGVFGGVTVPLPNGELLLVPHWLQVRELEEFGAVQTVHAGEQQVHAGGDYRVGGFPRPFQVHTATLGPHADLGSFHPTGRVLSLPDGDYLGMMTGRWQGPGEELRLIAIESADGRHWNYRSTIAGREWQQSQGGPNEGALARLDDGRLMCVFRHHVPAPFGKCFSQDNGQTWTEPVLMPDGVGSVKPSLVELPDGALALTGGRHGFNLWLDLAGDGEAWQAVDLLAHHNARVPTDEAITASTCYTDVVALDDRALLIIYDGRAPGWDATSGRIVPEDSDAYNRVWVVRVEVER